MWNNMKTAMLLATLMALCGLVGYALGGPRGLVLGFAFGGLGNLISFWFSDRIALAAMRAHPIERQDLPWLVDMVEDLAGRAGLPTPRVYVCPHAAPNAFATGRGPRHAVVAVTEGLLRNFPRHEVEGVVAHEIGHIKHRDILIATIAATLAGIISSVAWMMMWFGGGGHRDNNALGAVGALLMLILAPLAAALIQASISRSREFAADAYGGRLCGDPGKLASALQRLSYANERIPTDTNPAFHSLYVVKPLSVGGMASLFSTHPPIEQRIAALQRQAMGG
jgi:heat shock protein HtpX